MASKKKDSQENPETPEFSEGVQIDESGQVYGSGDGTSADFTGAGADGTVEEEEDPDE